jgi:hypothetical protein
MTGTAGFMLFQALTGQYTSTEFLAQKSLDLYAVIA